MAQTRQAERGIPQSAFYLAAAVVAAIVLSAMVATGSLNLFEARAPIVDRGGVNPAVIQAEREWERQRHQQSGYVDPLIKAGQEWERQRQQQSGAAE
jgi:hypothetical protein